MLQPGPCDAIGRAVVRIPLASRGHVSLNRLTWLTALPTVLPALLLGAPAAAQQAAEEPLARPVPPPPAPDPALDADRPLSEEEVGFSAETLSYDQDADIVTVTGEVRMTRAGRRLRADKVTWNRTSGEVLAEGQVIVTQPSGDAAYADRVQLTDSLRDGVADNLLLVLEDGGRLAARRGTRVAGVTTLEQAAYSPCSVVCDDGVTPKAPLWQITAVRVIHDPDRHRISYRDARLTLLGVPILWLPRFSHPDGSGEGNGSGLLIPDVRYGKTLGLEYAQPYYWQIADNRDLLITPHLYTSVLPMLEARYRQVTSAGAFRVEGYGTYSTQTSTTGAAGQRQFRGYIDASGTYQLDSYWTLSGSIRRVTDKTFLRRYDISGDDRLRSMLQAERIDADSYLSIAGWAFQGLRTTDTQGQRPIALPAIDYRLRLDEPVLGGTVQLQANSLSILRTEGQDTQRAFAGARWDLRRITPLGQELVLTGYLRGDAYHTADIGSTTTALYRGASGWHGRGIAAVAADMRWPFVGAFLGGTQRITPRVQFVASPHTRNLAIPNEDARAIDLEDSNLFALNRFAGYDRWEDGARVTYGLEYALDLPRVSLRSIVGQSYRFRDASDALIEGTGLASRTSDIVGRTTIAYGSVVKLTHRFRLDKDSLGVRRNEIDATVGSPRTYASVGYLRLNRDISLDVEDLRDREEVRFGGRLQLLSHWALWGSGVLDLTDREEDPLSMADGFEPVRYRIGIDYEDECFEFGITWKREYVEVGDARAGNSFLLKLSFKNLGR